MLGDIQTKVAHSAQKTIFSEVSLNWFLSAYWAYHPVKFEKMLEEILI